MVATKHASKKSVKSKKQAKTKSAKAGKPAVERELVTIDRRSRPDRRQGGVPVVVERRALQRREKVARRRQIDPTTCERDYSLDEIEFMNALDQYKRTSGRMFPTCSEVLEVLRGLGYQKTLIEASSPSSLPIEVTMTAEAVLV